MARGPGRHWHRAWLAGAACVGFGMGGAGTNALEPADLTAITEPLLASIAEEEERGGPLSPKLVEPLTSLGLAYQEGGEHVLAVAVLDRALYLKRVNEGLFGLDQAPLVRRMIDSERAIGRRGTAAELEERLLELARRNPLDPRASEIFRDAAERELVSYEQYLRGETPPQATIFEITDWQQTAARSVWGARRHYNAAMFALLDDPGENQAELAELEQRLTRTYYLEATNRRRWYYGPGDMLYGLGLGSYHRRLEYAEAGEQTASDYAQTLIELADWSLLFSRNGTAVKRYAEAYALLVEHGVPAAAIEQLFPTDVPVFLPTFESPLAGTGRPGSDGYVDVDFEIGKYGQPRKISIVAVAGDDGASASKYLAAAINHARFRPNPAVEGDTLYRLRYSLADGSLTPRL